jgi:hypothetical protein
LSNAVIRMRYEKYFQALSTITGYIMVIIKFKMKSIMYKLMHNSIGSYPSLCLVTDTETVPGAMCLADTPPKTMIIVQHNSLFAQ